jgi:hypothetical protein
VADPLDQELIGLGVTPGWKPPRAQGDPSSTQTPQSYPMVVGGQPLAASLGFDALAVAVDNRTGSSVYIQDAGRYVAPQTIGQVIRLPGVARGVASFQTPPNSPAETPIAGQIATLTFYPVPLQETAGWSLQINIANTPAVSVASGTVNIGNSPSVSILGTVTIGGTPTVLIGGTPAVTISGTPTVILGAGTASIGSISAIGSTVTVAGTINIGNTPAVTISGTPNVNIASGSVNISGTPNVNIQSQSVQVSTNQPQKLLSSGVLGANGTTTFNAAIDPGAHAVAVLFTSAVTVVRITGHVTGISYVAFLGLNLGGGAWPTALWSIADTSVDVTITTNAGGTNWWLVEVLDTVVPLLTDQGGVGTSIGAPVYLTASQLRRSGLPITDNKIPFASVLAAEFDAIIAGNGTLDIVTAIAGQTVWCHALNVEVVTAGATTVRLEDDNGVTLARMHGNVIKAYSKALHGASGTSGHKIRLHNQTAAATGELTGELLYVQAN